MNPKFDNKNSQSGFITQHIPPFIFPAPFLVACLVMLLLRLLMNWKPGHEALRLQVLQLLC